MTDDLERVLIEAVRGGDLAAAKVYSDWLQERGRGKCRYVIRIVRLGESLTESELDGMNASFQNWLNNESSLFVLPSGTELVLITDQLNVVLTGGRTTTSRSLDRRRSNAEWLQQFEEWLEDQTLPLTLTNGGLVGLLGLYLEEFDLEMRPTINGVSDLDFGDRR